MKIAILSNVNMNATVRMLKRELEVYDVEGYGNELGILMNANSSIYNFAPDIIFVLEDLMEILGHELDETEARINIEQWFEYFQGTIRENFIYYISDAYLTGDELKVTVNPALKWRLESIWQENLQKCVNMHNNVYIFPYRKLIENIGEAEAFSMKMWYMGRILHSTELQKQLCDEIMQKVKLEQIVPKKVLLLDLDNTLWGGLAGETDINPISLSEEHTGLAYKNLQRVILQMQKQGTILGIVSKNNEEDAMNIIKNHPHMVLKEEAFAIKKINWNLKSDNIRQIAEELNLGLDSMVFFDDNPTERELIKEMLPDVEVPDFPEKPEDLAPAMVKIYTQYFDRKRLTGEDLDKTNQYIANAKREQFKSTTADFDEFLRNLKIQITRKQKMMHLERITQLLNKTNQFNLTTRRHSQSEVQAMLEMSEKELFVYQVTDCFGDNGIVAVAIADVSGETAVIEEFVMSCRVMGKNIENAIIDDIEKYFIAKGYSKIQAQYKETAKNKPVSALYDSLGYNKSEEQADGLIIYEIDAGQIPDRNYKAEMIIE